MIEGLVLGTIQGLTEWLPVSSKSLLILAKIRIFGEEATLTTLIREELFLHMGTFFAALCYLRKDVLIVIQSAFNFKHADPRGRALLAFLFVSTFFSGLLGLGIYWGIGKVETRLASTQLLTGIIGVLLIVTGFVQRNKNYFGKKTAAEARMKDAIVTGCAQGLAVIPGFSRSGFTVAALIFQGIEKEEALRISFLMSLPAVLGGNIILNAKAAAFTTDSLIGLAVAFVTGIISMHVLLKVAHRVNFGYFVIGFGALTVLAALI